MSNELYHHGILGQKWGVRRFQNPDGTRTAAGKKRYEKYGGLSNKEYKAEKWNIRKEFAKQSKINSQIEDLTKQAYDLAEKYDFDGDDGGGGSTAADRAAGRKYMKIWDKVEYLENKRDAEARQKAAKHLMKKYGETTYKNLEDREVSLRNATAIAFLAGIWSIPVTAVALSLRHSDEG